MSELSAREKDILQFIQKEISQNGYPPTVRDICSALNIKSTSTVHKAMTSLAEQGYISKLSNRRRAIKVTGAGENEIGTAPAVREPERADVADVPVVGRIAAGTPILAEQNIEDVMPVPARYLGRGNNFMLRVHGDSMIEAGIFDGDYLLVNEQHEASNGQIVAAMIDGEFDSEATVKTFYRENGHVRLQPQNSAMEPIIVDDCEILGLVKGVFRYFS
jgi:repressor LexA